MKTGASAMGGHLAGQHDGVVSVGWKVGDSPRKASFFHGRVPS